MLRCLKGIIEINHNINFLMSVIYKGTSPFRDRPGQVKKSYIWIEPVKSIPQITLIVQPVLGNIKCVGIAFKKYLKQNNGCG